MTTGKKKKYTLSETLDSFDDLEVDSKKLKSLQIAIHLPVKSNDMTLLRIQMANSANYDIHSIN